MIRIKDIQDTLMPLVGWRSDAVNPISGSLQRTSSGMYYQDAHPLVTLKNLKEIAPNFDNLEYPAWSAESYKRVGDIVKHKGELYKAIELNKDKDPEMHPECWDRYYPFSDWLEDITKANIAKVANTLITGKMANGTAKAILEQRVLFDGAGRLSDRIEADNKVVGLELQVNRRPGATIKIDKIGLQFSKPGKVTLYLMHSSSLDPIKVITLDRKSSGGMEWFNMHDLFLPYLSDATDAGGSWYLVYDQRELPEGAQAINKDKDWSKPPCSSCRAGELSAYRLMSEYAEVSPFKVDLDRGDFNDDFNDDFSIRNALNMWDIADNIYTSSSNYGINLCISIHCDFTESLLMQQENLGNLLMLQMAETVISRLRFNPEGRINRSDFARDDNQLLFELEGDTQGRSNGIVYRLKEAYKAIDISLRGLNPVCLPCNRGGIRFTTA